MENYFFRKSFNLFSVKTVNKNAYELLSEQINIFFMLLLSKHFGHSGIYIYLNKCGLEVNFAIIVLMCNNLFQLISGCIFFTKMDFAVRHNTIVLFVVCGEIINFVKYKSVCVDKKLGQSLGDTHYIFAFVLSYITSI